MVPPASENVVFPVTVPGHAESTEAAPVAQTLKVTDPLSNADDPFTRENKEGVDCVPEAPQPVHGDFLEVVKLRVDVRGNFLYVRREGEATLRPKATRG